MAHLTTEIPFIPSYGYRRRAMYRVTVISSASGFTDRNSLWSYPLHVFDLPLQNAQQPELDELNKYFHAAGGRGHTFDMLDRFEDRSGDLDEAPTQSDATLGTAVAAQTDFQLVKDYEVGGRTQSRKITRPVADSVLIEVDGVLQALTTDYTIEPGGIIRFVVAMTGGEVVKAGFRFLVPVAFASDEASIDITNYSAGYVGNAVVQLVEIRE